MLTSDYYNNLIDASMKESLAVFFSNPNFKAIPYTFLQQNGHNVTAIKNSKLDCSTSIYFKGNDKNNMYVSVHVENDGDYMSDYVLKYNLTSKEYDDCKMLFEGDYIQAPLFIQELSKQKTATVESKVNLTNSAYEIAKEYFNDEYYVGIFNTTSLQFDIQNVLSHNNTFKANIRSVSTNNNNSCYLRTLEGTLRSTCNLSEKSGIFTFSKISFKSANTEAFKTNSQSVSYFGLSKNYTSNNIKNESDSFTL